MLDKPKFYEDCNFPDYDPDEVPLSGGRSILKWMAVDFLLILIIGWMMWAAIGSAIERTEANNRVHQEHFVAAARTASDEAGR